MAEKWEVGILDQYFISRSNLRKFCFSDQGFSSIKFCITVLFFNHIHWYLLLPCLTQGTAIYQMTNLFHLLYQYNIWSSSSDNNPICLYVVASWVSFTYLIWLHIIEQLLEHHFSCTTLSGRVLQLCHASSCTVLVSVFCIRRPHMSHILLWVAKHAALCIHILHHYQYHHCVIPVNIGIPLPWKVFFNWSPQPPPLLLLLPPRPSTPQFPLTFHGGAMNIFWNASC